MKYTVSHCKKNDTGSDPLRLIIKEHAVLCLVTQSCLTLCDPMDCSPPGSSVRGISQARVLEWVAISSSRGSSPPRGRTCVSCIAGRFFTNVWLTLPVFVAVLSLWISLPFRRLANFAFSSVKKNDQQRLLERRRPSQERGGTSKLLRLRSGHHRRAPWESIYWHFSGNSRPVCSIRGLVTILEAGR